MTDTAELLAQLRDIRVPVPPAEPAVWPLFIAVAAIALGVGALFRFFRQKRKLWVDDARLQIKQTQQLTPDLAIQGYAELLKRIVLTLEPANNVRTLHGSQWLQYLDNVFRTSYFTTEQGRVFGEDLYRKQGLSESDRDAIGNRLHKLINRRSRRLW